MSEGVRTSTNAWKWVKVAGKMSEKDGENDCKCVEMRENVWWRWIWLWKWVRMRGNELMCKGGGEYEWKCEDEYKCVKMR